MPQSLTQATVNKLVKGLITEASELTFPEEATIDEVNCVLNRDGSRQRRKGLEQLPATSTIPGDFTATGDYNYHIWKNAGGNTGLNILVIQASSTLRFFDLGFTPLTDGLKSFTVNLATYKAPAATSVSGSCSFTELFGILVVANGTTSTLAISYDKSTDSISVKEIKFVVRDFEWQSKQSLFSYTVLASTVSKKRQYDTYNAGWYGPNGSAALTTYIASRATVGVSGTMGGVDFTGEGTQGTLGKNNYPPLTIPWYSGKTAAGTFGVTEFQAVHAPTSVTGNGLFKLDFFNKDRSSASGISGLTTEVENSRFSATTTFGGRIWYAGLGSGKNSGKILFSQAVINVSADNIHETIGQCLQLNDPTSESLSDILDTDGGEIVIPGANNIKVLHPYNDMLFVFAENGVWVIRGVDGLFTPGSYYVAKVTETGIDSPRSFVSAENIPFWWSKFGIHTITFSEGSGFPIEENISVASIQTLFDNISVVSRSNIFADYDTFNKRLFWWYAKDEEDKYRRNKALVLDIPLRAFYPWSIEGTSTKYVIGSFYSDPIPSVTIEEAVTVASGDVTVASGTVFTLETAGGEPTDTRLIILYQDSGNKIGQFSSNTFKDIDTLDYSSFFETGYFFGGDLLIKKTTPYVTVYLRTTEDGFTGDEINGYTPINPSSLILKSYWDFKKEPSSTQQSYRIKPFAMVDTDDLTDNQQKSTVVTTRLKVRGKGRSVRLRFEAESGKDFIFLGYSMLVGINNGF